MMTTEWSTGQPISSKTSESSIKLQLIRSCTLLSLLSLLRNCKTWPQWELRWSESMEVCKSFLGQNLKFLLTTQGAIKVLLITIVVRKSLRSTTWKYSTLQISMIGGKSSPTMQEPARSGLLLATFAAWVIGILTISWLTTNAKLHISTSSTILTKGKASRHLNGCPSEWRRPFKGPLESWKARDFSFVTL